jgi:hypothetical protein
MTHFCSFGSNYNNDNIYCCNIDAINVRCCGSNHYANQRCYVHWHNNTRHTDEIAQSAITITLLVCLIIFFMSLIVFITVHEYRRIQRDRLLIIANVNDEHMEYVIAD